LPDGIGLLFPLSAAFFLCMTNFSRTAFGLFVVALGLASCSKDDVAAPATPVLRAKIDYATLTATSPYTTHFKDANGAATVALGTAATRFDMFSELNSYMATVAVATPAAPATLDLTRLRNLYTNANAPFAAISGGYNNHAGAQYASVSGGQYNTASGDYSSVSGGDQNTASGPLASVSGGFNNAASKVAASVSGGVNNTASGIYASVSGGADNTASGGSSSISGGGSLDQGTGVGWSAGSAFTGTGANITGNFRSP